MENYNPYFWDCDVTNLIMINLRSKNVEKPVWCVPPAFVRKTLLDYNYQCITAMQPFFVGEICLWPTTAVCITAEGNVSVVDEQHEVDMLFCTGSKLNAIVIARKDSFNILHRVLKMPRINVVCVISDSDATNEKDFNIWDYRLPHFADKIVTRPSTEQRDHILHNKSPATTCGSDCAREGTSVRSSHVTQERDACFSN